jgi:glycosyltransferase involved in cell wall biosynthesis
MSDPLVSILLPTYDRRGYLPKAIVSVLKQDYENWELIIWNDGSTDDTQDVVEGYVDDRIIYRSTAQNHGKSYALNQSLELVKGKYIALLDDDDQWYPNKLRRQVRIMEDYSDIDLLFTDYRNLNVESNVETYSDIISLLEEFEVETETDDNYFFRIKDGLLEALLIKDFIFSTSVLMKSQCVRRVGLFEEQISNGIDFEYFWRMLLFDCQFAFLKARLLFRVKPPKSLSGNNSITYENFIKALKICRANTIKSGRNDLVAHIDDAILVTWKRLIKHHAQKGERKEAYRAFRKSLEDGFKFKSFMIIIIGLISPRYLKTAKTS